MTAQTHSNSFSRERKISRQSLFIFIGLALLAIAQLSWWIIFQLEMIDERYQEYLSYVDSRTEERVSGLAPDFEQMRDLMMIDPSDIKSRTSRDSLRAALRDNLFMGNLVIQSNGGDTLFSFGEPGGDAGLRMKKPDITIFITLDFSHISRRARQAEPALNFIPPPMDSLFFYRLGKKNFVPDLKQSGAFASQHDSTRNMLISEGAFFVALTLFGLWLIYRALVRSVEARRSQENFLLAVTHELRTPLTSVRLALQGISRGKLSTEKTVRAYQIIDGDLERLDRLIDDLLQAGKSSAPERTPETIELVDFVKKYFERRAEEFAGKGVDLEIAGSPVSLTISASPDELVRALDIVVDNALKFSQGTPRIIVTLEQRGGKTLLAIKDLGIGIPPDETARVFDRFYRVGNEQTRRTRGVGLGLYLARRIMLAAGADISIHSDGPGKGACVTFTFSDTVITEVPSTSGVTGEQRT